MNTEQYNLLRGRFPEDQFALLTEVRDAAGHGAKRSIDALAMDLYPSRGLQLHGIEVKSNRGDWLKELKTPDKQETIFRFCHRFWLLATDVHVVKDVAEIPASWGYLLIKGSKIYTIKEAPLLKPQELTRDFVASMMKRSTNGLVNPLSLKDIVDKEVKEQLWLHNEEHLKLTNRFNELKRKVDEFEEITGLKIDNEYDYEDFTSRIFCKTVKVVLDNSTDLTDLLEKMRSSHRISNDYVDKVGQSIGLLEKMVSESDQQDAMDRSTNRLRRFTKTNKKK